MLRSRFIFVMLIFVIWCRRGHDRMVVVIMVVVLQLPTQLVPITTHVVSLNLAQARCTRYFIVWSSLSVTCGGSVFTSTNKTDRQDITGILLKVALNTITLTVVIWIFIYRCDIFDVVMFLFFPTRDTSITKFHLITHQPSIKHMGYRNDILYKSAIGGYKEPVCY